jgi:hypothetical protein
MDIWHGRLVIGMFGLNSSFVIRASSFFLSPDFLLAKAEQSR